MPIPGLIMPPGLIAGGGSPKVLLLKGYSIDGNYPDGIASGDIIVLSRTRHSAPSNTPPLLSGYTDFGYRRQTYGDDDDRGTRLNVKIADGSESGAIPGAGSPDFVSNWLCLVFSFGNGASGITPGTAVSSSSNSAPSNITIPASSVPAVGLAIGYWGSTGDNTTSYSASPPFDAVIGLDNGRERIGYSIYASGGVDITMSMGDHGNANRMIGNYLIVS